MKICNVNFRSRLNILFCWKDWIFSKTDLCRIVFWLVNELNYWPLWRVIFNLGIKHVSAINNAGAYLRPFILFYQLGCQLNRDVDTNRRPWPWGVKVDRRCCAQGNDSSEKHCPESTTNSEHPPRRTVSTSQHFWHYIQKLCGVFWCSHWTGKSFIAVLRHMTHSQKVRSGDGGVVCH